MLHTSGNQFYTSSKFYQNNMTPILPINTLPLSSTTSSSTFFPILHCRNYNNQQGSGNSYHNQNKYSHLEILTSETKPLHLSTYFFQNFLFSLPNVYVAFNTFASFVLKLLSDLSPPLYHSLLQSIQVSNFPSKTTNN